MPQRCARGDDASAITLQIRQMQTLAARTCTRVEQGPPGARIHRQRRELTGFVLYLDIAVEVQIQLGHPCARAQHDSRRRDRGRFCIDACRIQAFQYR
jgi:hypothetical protein